MVAVACVFSPCSMYVCAAGVCLFLCGSVECLRTLVVCGVAACWFCVCLRDLVCGVFGRERGGEAKKASTCVICRFVSHVCVCVCMCVCACVCECVCLCARVHESVVCACVFL